VGQAVGAAGIGLIARPRAQQGASKHQQHSQQLSAPAARWTGRGEGSGSGGRPASGTAWGERPSMIAKNPNKPKGFNRPDPRSMRNNDRLESFLGEPAAA